MRQARVEHGASTEGVKEEDEKRCKKRARFAIKSPIKLLNGLVPASGSDTHKGTKSRVRAVNLSGGIFITASGEREGDGQTRTDGRTVHRCHGEKEREGERFVPARAVLRLARLLAP